MDKQYEPETHFQVVDKSQVIPLMIRSFTHRFIQGQILYFQACHGFYTYSHRLLLMLRNLYINIYQYHNPSQ